MRLGPALLVAAFCAAFASPASAEVRVAFAGGRVTIVADNATVAEILAEWSRIGGSTFVDADKIPAAERLTIRLEDQLELDAIDVLLRSVAGYMVAPIAPEGQGLSAVGRVFILPTTTPVAYVPPPPSAEPMEAAEAEDVPRITSAPPTPDDDGPVRVVLPPAVAEQAAGTSSPLGQSSPLLNNTASSTQVLPGGAVTSSQPGVVIPSPAQGQGRPGGRPVLQPTRPGGGGGSRR